MMEAAHGLLIPLLPVVGGEEEGRGRGWCGEGGYLLPSLSPIPTLLQVLTSRVVRIFLATTGSVLGEVLLKECTSILVSREDLDEG